VKKGKVRAIDEIFAKISRPVAFRTGKEIRFRFWLSEDKAGKEAKCRPTGW